MIIRMILCLFIFAISNNGFSEDAHFGFEIKDVDKGKLQIVRVSRYRCGKSKSAGWR